MQHNCTNDYKNPNIISNSLSEDQTHNFISYLEYHQLGTCMLSQFSSWIILELYHIRFSHTRFIIISSSSHGMGISFMHNCLIFLYNLSQLHAIFHEITTIIHTCQSVSKKKDGNAHDSTSFLCIVIQFRDMKLNFMYSLFFSKAICAFISQQIL